LNQDDEIILKPGPDYYPDFNISMDSVVLTHMDVDYCFLSITVDVFTGQINQGLFYTYAWSLVSVTPDTGQIATENATITSTILQPVTVGSLTFDLSDFDIERTYTF